MKFTAQKMDDFLGAIMEMTDALKFDDWKGDKVRFFVAAEMAGIGDLASALWLDCHGPETVEDLVTAN